MTSTRICITLPAKLLKQLKRRPDINRSKVAQDALIQALSTLQPLSVEDRLSALENLVNILWAMNKGENER